MKQDLKDLIDVSRYYGSDNRAVIAGGGNTSLKTADRLWVKASGYALATIDEDGFAILDREKLQVSPCYGGCFVHRPQHIGVRHSLSHPVARWFACINLHTTSAKIMQNWEITSSLFAWKIQLMSR